MSMIPKQLGGSQSNGCLPTIAVIAVIILPLVVLIGLIVKHWD